MESVEKSDGWSPEEGTHQERVTRWIDNLNELEVRGELLRPGWTPATYATATHYKSIKLLTGSNRIVRNDLKAFFHLAGESGIASNDQRPLLYDRYPLRDGKYGTPLFPRRVRGVENWFETRLTKTGERSDKTGLVRVDVLFKYFSDVHHDNIGAELYALDPSGWVAPPPLSEEEAELRRHRVLVHHSGRLLTDEEMIELLLLAAYPRSKSGGVRKIRKRPTDAPNLEKQVMSRFARFRITEALDLLGRAHVRKLFQRGDWEEALELEADLDRRGVLPDVFLDIPRPESIDKLDKLANK